MKDRDNTNARDPMAEPAGDTAGTKSQKQRQFQIGLIDLISLVISLGIALGIAHESSIAAIINWWVYDYSLFGLALTPMAVWLWIKILGQVIQHFRRETDGVNLASEPFGLYRTSLIFWRMVAVTLLAGFVGEEVWLFRHLAESYTFMMRMRVLAVCGMLLMGGLVCGMQVGHAPRIGLARSTWARQITGWSIILGLLLVGAVEPMLSPYLVLVAIDSVSCATRHWEGSGPGSLVRLSQAALPATAALATCMVSGIWLSQDIRRESIHNEENHRGPRRFRAMLLRLLAIAAPAMAGIYILFVTMPRINSERRPLRPCAILCSHKPIHSFWRAYGEKN